MKLLLIKLGRAIGVATLLALISALMPIVSYALPATPVAQDPVVESRLMHISEELRCLVCQNESLAGSRADLAKDLRREVRTLIEQGKTDAEIKEFLVSRYGDFVLYRPPLKSSTWLLWLGPFILVALGIATLLWHFKQRVVTPVVPLTAQERARVDQLLSQHKAKDDKDIQEIS